MQASTRTRRRPFVGLSKTSTNRARYKSRLVDPNRNNLNLQQPVVFVDNDSTCAKLVLLAHEMSHFAGFVEDPPAPASERATDKTQRLCPHESST